jgi:hypothetical protein
MSGVNRNIIGNLSIPLAGGGISTGPAELDLITTSGSRWVMFEFPSKFVSSSEGGLCQNLVLEWTTDPAMVTNPLASSSAYYAVTSSVISCNSASLSPMTSSVTWVQYINSIYNSEEPQDVNSFYYIRGYQRTIAGYNPQIYSNVRSIQTRANNFCGAVSWSDENKFLFDVDGFIPTEPSKWYTTGFGPQDYSSAAVTSSVPMTIVKAGGPNYDAIKTNGATLSFTYPSVGAGSVDVQVGVGLVTGSVEIPLTTGTFKATATTSTLPGDVTWKGVSLASGINTINSRLSVGRQGLETYIFVNGSPITLVPGSGVVQSPANPQWVTSADCIMRAMYGGVNGTYPGDVYVCKYGQPGVNGYN